MDFRCFGSLDLEVSAEGAILTGDNAQGKTSVLEAICVLVRLHSPRTHRMNVLGKIGGKGFGIAGDPWGEVDNDIPGLVASFAGRNNDQSSTNSQGGAAQAEGQTKTEEAKP